MSELAETFRRAKTILTNVLFGQGVRVLGGERAERLSLQGWRLNTCCSTKESGSPSLWKCLLM
jgi:hypothetical protein